MGVATAILGGAVIGAGASAISSSKAAKAQRKGIDAASAIELEKLDRLERLNEPFRDVSLQAFDALANVFGLPGIEGETAGDDFSLESLVDSGPIDFLRERGERDLERNFNARGLRNSGREFEGLIDFNKDLTSTAILDLGINPLFSLAGLTQVGNQNISQAVSSTGTNLSNLALAEGDTRASAFGGTNDAIQGGVTNLTSFLALRNSGLLGGAPGANIALDDLMANSGLF